MSRTVIRQGGEVGAIVAIASLQMALLASGAVDSRTLCWLVAALAFAKAAWFVLENLYELLQAATRNLPYHQFMVLMLVNTAQVMTSFALDYWVLQTADAQSLGGIEPLLSAGGLLFECLYFSVLDFSFFGFGDVTPHTVPAKLVVMLEVMLAFFTMIFVLSDLASLKESLRDRTNPR